MDFLSACHTCEVLRKIKLRHLLLTFLIVLLLLSFLASIVVPIEAMGENWLTGWTYRKSHVINSALGAGTNYQVKITVHYGSGQDAAGDVYCNGNCQPSFGDIRWTSDDGNSLLDYWIESSTTSGNAVFWINVTADLSSTSQTIYLYYGNSAVSTTSSAANTFIRIIDGGSMVLSLPLDEGSGVIVYDKSGNGNNGAVNSSGTSFVTGKFGTGLHFDGTTNSFVNVTDSNTLDIGTNNLTISMWVNMSSMTGTQTLLTKRNATSLANSGYQLQLQSGTPYLYFCDGSTTRLVGHANTALSLNTWYFLVFVMQRNGNVTFYVNGTAKGTFDISTEQGSLANSVNLYLAKEIGYNAIGNGTLDEVNIFNRTLTAAEISDMFNYYPMTSNSNPGSLYVRKYVNPEPVNGIWGTEESIDSAPPTYSNISVNTTVAGALCSFNCLISDNVNVSTYIFSSNNTGTWVNDTATAFSSFYDTASAWANVTKTLDSTVGDVVSYLWYANDTSNNWSNSDQYSLTLTAPYRPNLQMTPDSIICREYNETFTVQINVTNAIDTQAFSFTIYYDPSILNFSSVTWGELGTGTITEIDTANGIIEGNVAGSTINGNCWLLNITFQDIATMIWKQGQINELDGQILFQQARLNFTGNSTLQYVEGGISQIGVNQAAYTFLPIKGDINNDGTVNILDLRTVAAYYDKTPTDPEWPEASKYDLNNDNIIDIFDLVVVATNFGFTYP